MRRDSPRGAVAKQFDSTAIDCASKSEETAGPGEDALAARKLEALLEVTSVVRGEKDLGSALTTIVRAVAESLEFGTVILNLYRPEFDDFCVTTVYGCAVVKEALLGSIYEKSSWQRLLAERFRRGGVYLIPHGAFDWSEDIGNRYVPQIEASSDPDAWHPEDELFVPLEDSEGRMLRFFRWVKVAPDFGRHPLSWTFFLHSRGHAAIAMRLRASGADGAHRAAPAVARGLRRR